MMDNGTLYALLEKIITQNYNIMYIQAISFRKSKHDMLMQTTLIRSILKAQKECNSLLKEIATRNCFVSSENYRKLETKKNMTPLFKSPTSENIKECEDKIKQLEMEFHSDR